MPIDQPAKIDIAPLKALPILVAAVVAVLVLMVKASVRAASVVAVVAAWVCVTLT